MGQFVSHPLFQNCKWHCLCMLFPQHVNHMGPSPNRGSASRQIEQISPSYFSSSSSTARAGAAALFASPADIKLAMFSAVRRGGRIPDWLRENQRWHVVVLYCTKIIGISRTHQNIQSGTAQTGSFMLGSIKRKIDR